MEIQTDQGLLVVNLENCITDAALQQIAKGDCIYTLAVSNSSDTSTVVQIPVNLQCNGSLQHAFNNYTDLQQQPTNSSIQFTQQQYDQQLQIAEQLQCLGIVERSDAMPQIEINPQSTSNTSLQIASSSLPLLVQPALSNHELDLELDYTAIYNYIDTKTIPIGASESYKSMLKKRSKNYSIIDKVLYHGVKKLRKVVIGKESQQDILKSYHIQEDTGIHLGVRKMHAAIISSYFWQELYVDITNFVRQCEGCSEALVTTLHEEIVNSNQPEQPQTSISQENTNLLNNTKELSIIENSHIWCNVEAQIYGPFPRTVRQNEYLLTVSDPVSRWIAALAIPCDNLPIRMANFIFETLCIFGFAKCKVICSSSNHFEAIERKYKDRAQQIKEVSFSRLNWNSSGLSNCIWTKQLVESVTSLNPVDWDLEYEKFLYKFRTTASYGLQSPFTMMFCRNPNRNLEEMKENVGADDQGELISSNTSSRRPLRCSVLQCRHCEEVFTSKISFRIHQRKHTEEARRRGILDGQESFNLSNNNLDGRSTKTAIKKKKQVLSLLRKQASSKRNDRLATMIHKNNSLKTTQQQALPQDSHRAELKASTVAAVREMLASTKEERRKRGKYQKYPIEIQNEMANYAVEHGNHAAVNYFSKKLGSTVSESTVRNMVHLYDNYRVELKEEIGRYAAAFGVEAASLFFTERLGHEVRQGLVRKFKRQYTPKLPDSTLQQKKPENVPNISPTIPITSTKQKSVYTAAEREEIGCYASQFSIADTVLHFSKNNQFILKKNTVRKFRKMYLEKNQPLNAGFNKPVLQQPIVQNLDSVQEPVRTTNSQTVDVINASLNLLNCPQMNPSSTFIYNHLYQTGVNQTPSQMIPLNQNAIQFHSGYANIQLPTTMSISYLQPSIPVIANQNDTSYIHQNVNGMESFQQAPTEYSYTNHHQAETVQSQTNPIFMQQQNASCNSILKQHYSATNASHTSHMPNTVVPPQTQHSYNQGNQQSLLISNQHFKDTQRTARPKTHQQLISRNSIEQIVIENQPKDNISDVFDQTLDNHTSSISFSNSGPTLIADCDGTYTITTTIDATDPITVQDNDSLFIETALTDSIQDETPAVNLLIEESPKNKRKMRKVLFSASGRRKTKEEFECEVECPTALEEEEVDDPCDDPCYNGNKTDNSSQQKSKRNKKQRKKPVKKTVVNQKDKLERRGTYTTYSPEIRAKMGKYAAEHGSLKTCIHFRSLLGHKIAESTVRGLRDKYLLKREIGGHQKLEQEVTLLGYSPRGRPTRLGKYDEVVQECIRELVKSGEKVSSFLAIATAKQVLMQNEPNLLEENGGSTKLNVTWAKSFLKRIGVRNNS